MLFKIFGAAAKTKLTEKFWIILAAKFMLDHPLWRRQMQVGWVKIGHFWRKMRYNYNKSCCLRIGPRCDAPCTNITTLTWTKEMRYLGVFFVQSRIFKCSIDNAKCSYYGAANAIFGKVARLASEEVTLYLTKSKYTPILIYGLVACPVNKTQLASRDFAINRFLIKLFCIYTSNTEINTCCREQFNFELPTSCYFGSPH